MKIKHYNNIIAILLVIFNILFTLNIFLINFHLNKIEYKIPEEEISGLATNGYVSLCISTGGSPPSINLFYPVGGEILDSTINISTNLSNEGGNTNFTLTFYHTNSSSQVTYINEDSYNGDYSFNVSWDTTSVADGNCNYKVKVEGESNETDCEAFDTTNSGGFTIDNTYVEPTWNNFNNSLRTNL